MSAKFKCRILQETEQALKISQSAKNRDDIVVWIPRSQCRHISKRPDGGEGIPAVIECEDWLIEKKGIKQNA